MVYEYACKHCGTQCEFEQRITDSPKKKCPNCKKMGLKRLISNTSFQLMGTGWFKSGGY